MDDANARFLERLMTDVERLLGPDIVVRDVAATAADARVRIAITCETHVGRRSLEATGENLIDAASALLARLPAERLALAFRRLVEEHAPTR